HVIARQRGVERGELRRAYLAEQRARLGAERIDADRAAQERRRLVVLPLGGQRLGRAQQVLDGGGAAVGRRRRLRTARLDGEQPALERAHQLLADRVAAVVALGEQPAQRRRLGVRGDVLEHRQI